MQQYVVKPHDTLYLISKEFNIPLAQLIRANPQITNPNLIYEGQTINIPSMLPVPDQIDIIESNAVAIIDDIFRADWQSADRRINEVRTAMNSLVPILQAAEVPDDIIFELNEIGRAHV
jgi:LysM repeat protein